MIKKSIAIITGLTILLTAAAGCGDNTASSSDGFYSEGFYVDSGATSSDNDSQNETSSGGTSTDSSSSQKDTSSSGDKSSGSSSDSNSSSTVVSTNLTDKQLAAKISYNASGKAKSLNVKTGIVFDYDEKWSFNHGAYIQYFKGKFYAFWQQGYDHEDACGQHIVWATSTDGLNWSEAKDFIPVKTDRYGNEMLSSPFGTYVYGDKLIVYTYEFGYDPNELAASNIVGRPTNADSAKKLSKDFYIMYTTDGVNWKRGSTVPQGGGNRDPRIIDNRLYWAGFVGIAYSDDLTGLSSWMTAGPSLSQVQDALNRGGFAQLTEGSIYKSKDGIMHFVMRSSTQYLWATSSKDNGETWGDIYQTNFTDDAQKFDFMELPDGRIMYIGTPMYTGRSNRLPLIAAVSEDGYNFNKQYIVGNTEYAVKENPTGKIGHYSYPSAIIKDDYVYVIYAKRKEIIEVSRFKWTDLK